MPKPTYQPLYSGIYLCADCENEWELTRARELRCPECGSDDLEEIVEEQDAEPT